MLRLLSFSAMAAVCLFLLAAIPLQKAWAEGPVQDTIHAPERSIRRAQSAESADFIWVSWNPKYKGRYQLDVKPVGADYIAPCVGHRLLRASLSYIFDGRCPSAAAKVIGPVESFRVCISSSSAGTALSPERASCVEAMYQGGSTLHIDTARDQAGSVVLHWPAIPQASYRLNLRLKGGISIRNCARTTKPEYVFDGSCPEHPSAPVIALANVKQFEVESSVRGQWTIASTRDVARTRYDGKAVELSMRFRRFRDLYFEEQCSTDGSMDPDYPTSRPMTAQICRDSIEPDYFANNAPDARYQKRRLTNSPDFIEMGYPRSAVDSDGAVYLLFSTTGGGFPPAGTPQGCRELNLVRTNDFLHYVFVAQVERLCGHQRLDNGELAILGERMYVTFHTISGAGQCTTADGNVGARWQLRLKVSHNYRSTPAYFSDLGGREGADILHDLCVADGSSDGFWEPFVYRSADRILRIAYTDDTPPEVLDGKCNQSIRLLGYSEDQRKVISDNPVGNCSGDKREGMPVVALTGFGNYGMVFESLGAPSNQVKMVTSPDGITWSSPKVLADVSLEGGTGVGCPYLRYIGDRAYVSFYHTYRNPLTRLLTSNYQIRILDRALLKRMDVLVEKRARVSQSDGAALYWGSINVVGDQIYALGAGDDSSPFLEIWLPRLGE